MTAAGPRIVVTGLGAVTPLGLNVQDTWLNALAGMSGAAPITYFDATGYPTQFACELKGFNALDYIDAKLIRRLDVVCHYGIAAADEALLDAGLSGDAFTPAMRDDMAVVFGSGVGGLLLVWAVCQKPQTIGRWGVHSPGLWHVLMPP